MRGEFAKIFKSVKYYDHDYRSFSWLVMFKEYRDSIRRVVTLAEIQNVREASHHLTLMHNCQNC